MKSLAAFFVTMLSVAGILEAQSPAPSSQSAQDKSSIVRSIKYVNFGAIDTQDILRAFQENNVKLKVETAYDQQEINRATAVLKDLLGKQNASVNVTVKALPPNSLGLTFTAVTP